MPVSDLSILHYNHSLWIAFSPGVNLLLLQGGCALLADHALRIEHSLALPHKMWYQTGMHEHITLPLIRTATTCMPMLFHR